VILVLDIRKSSNNIMIKKYIINEYIISRLKYHQTIITFYCL